MSNYTTLLDRLSTSLGIIKEKVQLENSANLMNINLNLESKILEIFNLTEDLEIKNANLFKQNMAGVDGIDDINKIVVQVTSTFSNEKIEHTIDQVIKQSLYRKYPRLIIIFLKDKKPLSPAFKLKMLQKTKGLFDFDFDRDLLDLKNIYSKLSINLDINKIQRIQNHIDGFIDYLPKQIEESFDAISVCFHDEEVENAFKLVDRIVREGTNVFLNSKALFDKFVKENHPHRHFLIFADPITNLDSVKFCVAIYSTHFLYDNFSPNSKNKNHLFEFAFNNDLKIERIAFNQFIGNISLIQPRSLSTYQGVTDKNLNKIVKSILQNHTAAAVFSTITPEQVAAELIQQHKIFEHRIINRVDYFLIYFFLHQQETIEINYLILNKDYVLVKTVSDFNNRFKLKYSKNLNVLVPKDFAHVTRKRLDVVKQQFKQAKVLYIDEHVFDIGYDKIPKKPLLDQKDFVTPVVKHKGEYLGINDIVFWVLNNSDSSIAIIIGSGGIGKTTISQKIHDTIIENHDRTILLFIDAHQYIEVFKKRINENAEYDLYKIFEACHPYANIIDQNAFYLLYALGNIIIFIDGIDEIISTIPSFSLHNFLENLEQLRKNIGRGRIIINCRDSYIKDLIRYYEMFDESRNKSELLPSASLDNIQIYELLGFDESLSMQYFSNHFTDKVKQNHCMDLLKEFFPHPSVDGDYIYPPFILEIVTEIVNKDFNYEEINVDFKSDILCIDETNDIVIFRICNREIAKKEEFGFDLEVDKQVQFFCKLATEENGNIQINGFERILINLGITDRLSEVINGLTDHPLLIKTNGHFRFKFDFFTVYFKSLFIINILTTKSDFKVSDRLVNVLCDECNYNSVLFKLVISKISKPDQDFKLILHTVREIITKINTYSSGGSMSFLTKQKAISNTLLLLLKAKKLNSFTNKYIIEEIFGEVNSGRTIVSQFYFIDVPNIADIILDFTEMIFTHSEITNYANFFKCTFNEDTFFDENCLISNVYSTKVDFRKISATVENFDRNIKGDNSISKIFKIKNNNREVVKYIKTCLKSFHIGLGRSLIKSKQMREIDVINDDVVTREVLVGILLNNQIFKKVENSEVFLNEKLEVKITKFLTQNIPFTELSHSIKELESFILN
jgi:hypothetical protein